MIRSNRNSKLLDSIRKHYTGVVFSHSALEVTAQACSIATGRSKSLLELAFWKHERSKMRLCLAYLSFEGTALLRTVLCTTSRALRCQMKI